MLVRWITFYEQLYELDDVERPTEEVINDDEALDKFIDDYKTYQKRELIKYHKSRNTPHVDRGVPKPIAGTVVGKE